MKKKILIFSTAYFPYVGGAEVAIKEITNRLQSEYTFDLITARLNRALPKQEQIDAVTVYRLGIGIPIVDKLLLPCNGALLAYRLNKKSRYDLFWGMMVTFGSGAAYVAKILLGLQVPIVLTIQEGDSEAHLRYRWVGLIGSAWRLALRRSNFVTVISSYLEDRVHQFGYRGQLEVIPNGVDIRLFEGASVPHEGLSLITTSRLVYKNGIDDVILALPLLPQVRFRIYGTGSDEEMLKKLSEKLGVGERVEFLGQMEHSQLPSALHKADIFIRPSRSEGMGNSFIEAMAAGLPVIATQEGGIRDFLFDPKLNPDKDPTGRAVNPHDPEGVAQAVKLYLADKEMTKRIVSNAKKMVQEKYDWKLVAQDMKEKVFDELLK